MLYGVEDAMRNGVDDGPAPRCGDCMHWMPFSSCDKCGLCTYNWALTDDCTEDDVDICVMDEWHGPCRMYDER